MDPGVAVCGLIQGQQRARRLAGLPEPPDCWRSLPSFNDDSDSPSAKPDLSISDSVNTFRTHLKSTLSSSLSGRTNRLHSVWARSVIILGCEGQGWPHNSPPRDSWGHKNLPTSSFRVRNSSGCERQDVPIRQRDRQNQGETRGGCLCRKLTRAAWPAPLFRDRREPLSPEANAN